MKRGMVFMAGLVMMMACLWVGAYVLDIMLDGHWSKFPTIMTSALFGCLGYLACMYASVGMRGK